MNLSAWITSGRQMSAVEHLALPIEIEESRPAQFSRTLLVFLALVVAAALAWASVTPIRELAIAPGQVLPKGDIRSVQHLEGGIVASIATSAGETVHTGDVLLTLADDQALGDLRQYQVRSDGLTLEKQQLKALLGETELSLRPAFGLTGDMASAQLEVFSSRLTARLEETKQLEAQVEQRLLEIAAAQTEVEGFRRLVSIQEEQMAGIDALFGKGLSTKRELLNSQAALESAKSAQGAAEGRLASLREQLIEARSRIDRAKADARMLWSEELAKVESDLGETQQVIAKLYDRVERLTVRSPTDGIVQFILPHSAGEVVKPGDTIARIVPIATPLQAEVEVRADDIGYVKVGDAADIKVSTFDPSVFGKLHGTVSAVSPSTYQRQNGDYFFKATVQLDDTTFAGRALVTPGMVVTAEIVTGAKSFLHYLLRPIFKTLGPAFTER